MYANHHVDYYPPGQAKSLGVEAKLLKGRQVGRDYNNDSGSGFNMYMATGMSGPFFHGYG